MSDQTISVYGIESWLIPGDVDILHRVALAVRDIPGAMILEVGSYLGGSAVAMSAVAPSAEIHCVDTWQGSEGMVDTSELLRRFLHNVRGRNIRPIMGRSFDVLQLLPDDAYAVVYIDGDHSAAGAYHDMARGWSKLRVGGVMLVHDCVNEVAEAMRRFCSETGVDCQVTPPPHAHYMATLTKGEE